MRTGIIISCIIGMLCLAQQGIAEDQERSADHDSLRSLREKVTKSMNAGDMKGLRDCLAKEFIFIASDQTVLTDLDGMVKYWDGIFKDEKSPVTCMTTTFTADILTEFTDPNTGYCRGTSRDVYTLKNGRKIALNNTWSAVLVKENGEWKVAVAHVGVNFMDNPILAYNELSWFSRMCIALHLCDMPGEVKE